MNKCRNWQETLWLDLHGELNHAAHAEWERHMAVCENCRREKARTGRMMDLIRVETAEPKLPTDGAKRVIERLRRRKVLDDRQRPRDVIGKTPGLTKIFPPLQRRFSCCIRRSTERHCHLYFWFILLHPLHQHFLSVQGLLSLSAFTVGPPSGI